MWISSTAQQCFLLPSGKRVKGGNEGFGTSRKLSVYHAIEFPLCWSPSPLEGIADLRPPRACATDQMPDCRPPKFPRRGGSAPAPDHAPLKGNGLTVQSRSGSPNCQLAAKPG